MRAAGNIPARKIARVLDANLNRAREGIRVAEEVYRFCRPDVPLARKLKKLRHDLTRAARSLPFPPETLKLARDVESDAGRRAFSRGERSKKSLAELAMANFARAQEALRVLEEFSKLLSGPAAGRFKKIRFAAYRAETEMLKKGER